MNLTDLGKLHNTDKAKFHNFTDFYEKYFVKKQFLNNNILEIGIGFGGSLRMLKDYFVKSQIYGMEIDPKNFINEERISSFYGNQEDEEWLKNNIKNDFYDIIIDDGGHKMKQQQVSLSVLFKKLKSDGFYILEDLHTSLEYNENSTLNIINALRTETNYSSAFFTTEDFNYIKNNVKLIDIFIQNHFNTISITSILIKK